MKGKIICGFAGIGKSYCAKNRVGVVDLESTPFEKDWDMYIKVAKHMADNGYIVLLSCHKELRERLDKNHIDFEIQIPFLSQKEEYLQRYKDRGNTEQFIKMMEENWEQYLNEIIGKPNAFFVTNKYLQL